jgi:hypothetical protein
MKKILSVAAIVMISVSSFQCNSLKKLGWYPSELEMITALKDALSQGLFRAFNAFADPNGNPIVRFAFPGEAEKIEKTLRNLGFDKAINDITAKFTRAMSSAVKVAQPAFFEAVKRMTIRDATKILITDNPHAATEYFKQEMKPELMIGFRPIVDSSIKVEGADKEWSKIARIYNDVPFINKPLENSLTDFISARAIDLMFLQVASEEEQIRAKYEFRKTDLMQKVFGWADKELQKRIQHN